VTPKASGDAERGAGLFADDAPSPVEGVSLTPAERVHLARVLGRVLARQALRELGLIACAISDSTSLKPT